MGTRRTNKGFCPSDMPSRLAIDHVNNHVLHRQHLTSASRGSDVLSVVRDIGPVRATPAMTPYLSLWARCDNLQRQQLDDALYHTRSLVRVPAIHSRLYVIPTDHLPAYFQISRSILGGALRDLDRLFPSSIAGPQGTPFGTDLTQRVLEVVSTLGSVTADELCGWLPVLKTPLNNGASSSDEKDRSRWGARLIPLLCAQGLLIRADTVGGWRSEVFRYAALASWLPDADLEAVSFEEALRRVVLHYVGAFGPVSVGDIIRWLGGIPRQQVVATLMGFGRQLMRVQIEGFQGEYFVVRDEYEALEVARPIEHDVVLLPPRDSLMTAYSDPHRLTSNYKRLNHPYDAHIYDRVGEAMGTVWLGGVILGTWGMQIKESRINVRLFEPQNPEVLATVGEEARRLARWADFLDLELDIKTFAEEEAEEETFSLLRPAWADRPL